MSLLLKMETEAKLKELLEEEVSFFKLKRVPKLSLIVHFALHCTIRRRRSPSLHLFFLSYSLSRGRKSVGSWVCLYIVQQQQDVVKVDFFALYETKQGKVVETK